MPKIVAFMRSYNALESKASAVCDTLSEELAEAFLYSYTRHRTEAMAELPTEQGMPLAGPQSIKEIFAGVKAELQDMAHKMGVSLVEGMAQSFRENMPLMRAKVQAPASETPPLYSLIPGRKAVIDLLLGHTFRTSHLNREALELVDDSVSHEEINEEIKALQEELEKIDTESHFAKDVELYKRCVWQSNTLKKRIWLYVFHMVNFFWNSAEAEKSRKNEGIVKMLLWLSGTVFSAVELRKSTSFRHVLSFQAYTPERLGLSIMKITFVAFLVLQLVFTSFGELTYLQGIDKGLEKVFFSIIASTITSIAALSLLNRGFNLRIEKSQAALTERKTRLQELLAERQAILKKA